MQIQRIQTLWLILAIITATVSFAYPWLSLTDSVIRLTDNAPMMILAVLAAILPLLGIFMFRNIKRQKTIVQLATLFAFASITYAVTTTAFHAESNMSVCILGPSLMIVSGIFNCLAIKGIKHDAKLLRDSERGR